ncbi:N-acetylmuramoyl-L-alanine amidase [Mucilaginibacter sp.]|jgi:N-acetylmuramoyl-L-alanine amidase|uniref:N-acetylmuramoyl-L-alanine amidase family protein n=1 Tax=Mucilaginibacter sp. TaxID=1882438 RepID=UPI002B9128C4|nr:N-acetylmuramoyl-L-alanine amidase [Mucilaginibacter sp.]HTI61664.1 N-acetylmuramoyl-L-alanine amidase [Mucilaginibacter sp.]
MKNKALKRLIYSLLTFVISFTLLSFKHPSPIKKDPLLADSSFRIRTIIVDAGHGERPPEGGRYSPGTQGSYSFERDITLSIAKKLQAEFEKDMPDVKIVMTRTNKYDVIWGKRAEIANSNRGDLFISIHCNALPNRTIREVVGHKHHKPVYRSVSVPDRSGKGVLLLVYSTNRIGPQNEALRENEIIGDDNKVETSVEDKAEDPMAVIMLNRMKNKFRKQSIRLADLINDEFTQTDGRPSDGVREQVVFVLDHTAMPSVLVETGYLNNHDDEDYLNSEKGQNEIVASIVRAVEKYRDEAEAVSKN